MGRKFTILSQLTGGELEAEASESRFAKWATPCLLRALDLPTLDAVKIPLGSSRNIVSAIAKDFSKLIGTERLMVRSDGGVETRNYFRGGVSLDLDKAIEIAATLATDRLTLFLEPTNRFANLFTMNLLLVRGGGFAIEVLGPGYDVSDLNRGGVPPHCVITSSAFTWDEYLELRLTDVRVKMHPSTVDDRRRARLLNIGQSILPNMGIHADATRPEKFAEDWLRAHNLDFLWRPWQFELDLSRVQRWYEDAFLVANRVRKQSNWTALVLSASVLPGGRFIYWDVVDGAKKWAR